MKGFVYALVIFGVVMPSLSYGSESVYFIHGFMRRAGSMKKMAHAFEKLHYETHLWGYPSRDKAIEEHAESLAADLKRAAAEHPGEKMHFVTHSLGGIILRGALNHPDCPEEAKQGRAVLLAPPNRGSSLARYLNQFRWVRRIFGNKTGRQLLTSEHFDGLGEFPSTMEVLVISGTWGWNPLIEGKNDGKVSVLESVLTTPHKQVLLPCGHGLMMFSKGVIKEAVEFIRE